MSTYNIPFSVQKKKIAINYPKFAAKGFFLGTQELIRNSRGKRAISVRATEVLLYVSKRLYTDDGLGERYSGVSVYMFQNSFTFI